MHQFLLAPRRCGRFVSLTNVRSGEQRGDTSDERRLYSQATPLVIMDDLPTQAILKSVTPVIMHGVTCQASIIQQHPLPHPVGADTVDDMILVFH